MKEKGQKKSFTMRRSGWSSFSIIGFVIFGILLPALLLTHVFSDYATYLAGYAAYAEKTIEENIATYENDVGELSEKLAVANATIAENKETIEAIDAEIENLDAQIKAKQIAKQACQTAISTYQTEVNNLNVEISLLESEKAVLEAERDVLNVKIQELTAEIQGQKSVVCELKVAVKEKEITVLNAQKAVLEQTLNGLDKYEVDAMEAMNAEIERLEGEILAIRQGIVAKYDQYDANIEQSKAIEETMKPKQTAIKDAQKKLDGVNQEIEKFQASAATREKKIAESEKVIVDTQKQITDAKPSIGDLAISLTDLAMEIQALEDEKAQLDVVADAEKIAEIDAKLVELNASYNEKQQQFDDAYKTRKTQETKIEEQQKIIVQETTLMQQELEQVQRLQKDKVQPVEQEKAKLAEEVAAHQTAIDDLAKVNTDLEKEIEADKTAVQEKKAEIVVCQKVLGGLDATEDAEKIAKLEAEIAEIDALITKWNNGELQADATPIADYTGAESTIKEQALKQAIGALKTEKENLAKEQNNQTVLEEDLTAEQAKLADNATKLTEKEGIISTKTSLKTEKETAIATQESAVTVLDNEIATLNDDEQAKTTNWYNLQQANTAEKHNVEVWGKNKDDIQKRIDSLKQALKGEAKALLHPEEVAIITAFEKDVLSEQAPYQAEATATGMLTTSKLFFETMGLGMSQVELITYIFAVMSVLFFFGAIIVVCNRTRKARRTQYIVTENVIQCQNGALLGKKFILAEGATVRVRRSFKGGFFGYGSLIISMGAGFAGEYTIQQVKSVRKMKRLLQEQISRYGKPVMAQQTQQFGSGMPFGQNYSFPIVPFPMMPMMTEEDDEESCPCPYNQPMPCPYED